MKLYRIVPDTFTLSTNPDFSHTVLDKTNFSSFEDLYYMLGYTSFYTNPDINEFAPGMKTYANTFSRYSGKFFFLKPQHAIQTAKQILAQNGLRTVNFRLLEYDFPIDLITQYIGVGWYDIYGRLNPEPLVEFFIDEKEFINNSNNNLSIADQDQAFFTLIGESWCSLCNTATLVNDNRNDLCYNWVHLYDLTSLYYKLIETDNMNDIRQSVMYQTFINNKDSIYKCDYITGNMTFIDPKDLFNNMYNDNNAKALNSSFAKKLIAFSGNKYDSHDMEELVTEVLQEEKKDSYKVKQLLHKIGNK